MPLQSVFSKRYLLRIVMDSRAAMRNNREYKGNHPRKQSNPYISVGSKPSCARYCDPELPSQCFTLQDMHK